MLSVRIIPFNISVKSLNRSFHVSSINYNEISDLKARIDALKETSTISTDNNSLIDTNIMLTDEQASKLLNLDEIIKLNKQLNQADSAPQEFVTSTDFNGNLESNLSSFEEAFPNYGKTVVQESTTTPQDNAIAPQEDEKLGLLVRIIKNIVNTNNDVLLLVLKDKGIIAGTLDILKNYPLTTMFTLSSNVKVENIVQHKAELDSQIEVLKGQLTDLESKVANNSNDLSKLSDLSDKLDKTLNIGVDLFKSIVSNQSNIDLFTSTAALIGPFIAYRGLLRTYINAIDPIASNYSPSSIKEYNDIVRKRSLLIKKFNRITIPIVGTYFLYIGVIRGKLLTKGVEKQLGTANLASVSFLGKKINIGKWILLIFIGGAYWFIKTYVIPAYKIEYPESYNYISTIISNYGLYILFNSLFLWCFGLCILYAIEIYVFLLYSIKKEGIKIPKFLPQLTQNWLKILEEDSKADNKEAYVHMYCRNLLIHLLVVLIIVFIKFWFLV